MADEINKPENRGYIDNGIAAFKEAVAAVHAAQLRRDARPGDAKSTTPSARKPALAMLPACFINPGDVTLMTVPGYPVAGTHTRYYGGSVFRLPLLAENNFLPDLEVDSRRRSGSRPSCWSSTIPTAPPAKRRRASSTSRSSTSRKQHEFVVVQDAAHAMLVYDGRRSASSRCLARWMSASKSIRCRKGFDMIGWRIGWVCGHARIVQAFADVKDNSDSGQFGAIQQAAVAALDDGDSRGPARSTRLEKLVATLSAAASRAKCRAAPTFSIRLPPRGSPTAPNSRTPKPPAST